MKLILSVGKEPKEKDIEKACLDYFSYILSPKEAFIWKNPSSGYYDPSKKCFRRHTSPYAINGTPDAYIIKNGHCIGIEFKTRSGRLSESQKQFKERFTNSGGLYFVCRSIDDAQIIVTQIKQLS